MLCIPSLSLSLFLFLSLALSFCLSLSLSLSVSFFLSLSLSRLLAFSLTLFCLSLSHSLFCLFICLCLFRILSRTYGGARSRRKKENPSTKVTMSWPLCFSTWKRVVAFLSQWKLTFGSILVQTWRGIRLPSTCPASPKDPEPIFKFKVPWTFKTIPWFLLLCKINLRLAYTLSLSHVICLRN